VSVFVVPGEGEETGPRDHLLLLADCSRDDWAELLANTEPMRVNAGDLVIAAGEVDRSLYFLTEGPGRHRRHIRINAGSVVGEQAFLDSRPRSAEVRAVIDCELLRLSTKGFDRLAASNPRLAQSILFDLGRILSLRLRRAVAVGPVG
jgi:CRP-like cAMP-binding protein